MASGPETAVRTESNSPPAVPNSWIALGQLITRFQPEKVAPWLGFRNGLGVALSLAIGVVMGNVGSGLVLTTGALNVSFADSQDPYLQRARRMLAASILVGLAVFTGALCANDHVIAVVVVLIGSFAAGMLVAVGTTASDIGTITVVTLAVYAAQPMTPRHALYSGLLAFAGGLFQMFLSLALWKVRRYHPERRVLAELYLDLSRTAALPVEVSQSPPGSAQGIQAQAALAALGTDYSIEGERYRFLLSQAERIRLSLLALAHLRRRLRREDGTSLEIETLDHCFKVTSRMLSSVGTSLFAGEPVDTGAECLLELHSAAEGLRREQPDRPSQVVAMLLDARYQMDALAGQLRSVVDLAASATPAGLEAFERRESRQPLHLRLAGVAATLRANLTLNSAACRHAIRLAICTALGDAIGRAFSWNRTYWIPMTIIIVLKPDFSSTLSRGILRFAGTFAGLLFATGLFHLLSPSRATEIILIGLLMFVLRCYGPANYGIAATAVTALVVLLFAVSGIAPRR